MPITASGLGRLQLPFNHGNRGHWIPFLLPELQEISCHGYRWLKSTLLSYGTKVHYLPFWLASPRRLHKGQWPQLLPGSAYLFLACLVTNNCVLLSPPTPCYSFLLIGIES